MSLDFANYPSHGNVVIMIQGNGSVDAFLHVFTLTSQCHTGLLVFHNFSAHPGPIDFVKSQDNPSRITDRTPRLSVSIN
jgi:hypothetical protein